MFKKFKFLLVKPACKFYKWTYSFEEGKDFAVYMCFIMVPYIFANIFSSIWLWIVFAVYFTYLALGLFHYKEQEVEQQRLLRKLKGK